MRDRIAIIGQIAAVAGMLGICCALPVLLSIGVVAGPELPRGRRTHPGH